MLLHRLRSRLAGQPALHFLLLGGALFLLDSALGGDGGVQERVVLERSRIESLRRELSLRTGEDPTGGELEELVEGLVREEILVREAHRLGLADADPLIRERLIRNLEFVGESGGETELLQQARELAMDRTDPVVRRRLVELMEVEMAADVAERPVEEARLRKHFQEHREAFLSEPRLSFLHLFFDREPTGPPPPEAEVLQRQLTSGEMSTARARQASDPFVFGEGEELRPMADVAKAYGRPFAETLRRLPVGSWQGPVSSNWGWHLVLLEERRISLPPTFEEVRGRVEEAVREERARKARDSAWRALRSRYEVVVEESP